MGARFVDRLGRRVEIIQLDRGRGPRPYYRVSWHRGVLLGHGYYRLHDLDAVLELVDAGSLVRALR